MSEFTIGFPISNVPGLVGDDLTEHRGVLVDAQDLTRHTTLVGASGSGKSLAIKRLIEGAVGAGASVLAVDLLGDLAGVAEPRVDTDRFKQIVTDRNLPVEDPEGMDTTVWTLDDRGARFRMPLGAMNPTMVGGLLGAYTSPMQVCIDAVIRVHGHTIVTIADMARELRRAAIFGVGGTSPSAKTCDVLIARCNSLEDRLGPMFGPATFDFEADIVNSGRVNIIDARPFASVDLRISLAGLVGSLLEMAKDLPPSDDLKLLVVLDECSNYFTAQGTQLKAALRMLMDSYADAWRGLRKKGVGLVAASQGPKDIPEFVMDNSGTYMQMTIPGPQITTKAVTGLVGGDLDRPSVERTLRNMTTGQAVVRTKGGSFAIDALPPACSIASEPADMSKILRDSRTWYRKHAHIAEDTSIPTKRTVVG